MLIGESEGLTEWLNEQGIDPRDLTKRYDNNDTALHIASRKGNARAVRWLIEMGADVNAANLDGNPPMWHACFAGSEEIVRDLAAAGADVNQVNDNHTTSLMYCSSSGRESMVKLLIDLGADKSLENLDGYTALDHATTYTMVKMLK